MNTFGLGTGNQKRDYEIMTKGGEKRVMSSKKSYYQSDPYTATDLRDAYPDFVSQWLLENDIDPTQWRDPKFRKKFMTDLLGDLLE